MKSAKSPKTLKVRGFTALFAKMSSLLIVYVKRYFEKRNDDDNTNIKNMRFKIILNSLNGEALSGVVRDIA